MLTSINLTNKVLISIVSTQDHSLAKSEAK